METTPSQFQKKYLVATIKTLNNIIRFKISVALQVAGLTQNSETADRSGDSGRK